MSLNLGIIHSDNVSHQKQMSRSGINYMLPGTKGSLGVLEQSLTSSSEHTLPLRTSDMLL